MVEERLVCRRIRQSDLSHETYVHQKTIGNDEEESIASFPAKVSVEGDCLIRAHREMPNIVAPTGI